MWEIVFIIMSLLCMSFLLYDHFDDEDYVKLKNLGKNNSKAVYNSTGNGPDSHKYTGHKYSRKKQRRAKGQYT